MRALRLAMPLVLALSLLATRPCAAIERWFYVSQNLWVDANITNVVALMQRAA